MRGTPRDAAAFFAYLTDNQKKTKKIPQKILLILQKLLYLQSENSFITE
jgi:hypothetical protein